MSTAARASARASKVSSKLAKMLLCSCKDEKNNEETIKSQKIKKKKKETRKEKCVREKKDINIFISQDFFFSRRRKHSQSIPSEEASHRNEHAFKKKTLPSDCRIHEKNIKRASWLNVPRSASCYAQTAFNATCSPVTGKGKKKETQNKPKF